MEKIFNLFIAFLLSLLLTLVVFTYSSPRYEMKVVTSKRSYTQNINGVLASNRVKHYGITLTDSVGVNYNGKTITFVKITKDNR